jgi:hypothetical protein
LRERLAGIMINAGVRENPGRYDNLDYDYDYDYDNDNDNDNDNGH